MDRGCTEPIRYRVVVRGRVGRELEAAFEGLDVAAHAGESSLTGTFADAAQL